MPKSGDNRIYRCYAQPLRAVRSLLWLAAALSVAIGAGSAAFLALPHVYAPTVQRFTGELRPASDPIAIDLPAGAMLDQIVVSRGDEVRAGQTLATLDVPALEQRLGHLEREVIGLSLLRNCLLHPEAPAQMYDFGEDQVTEVDAETMVQIDLAERDCALHFDTFAATRSRLTQAQRLLEERRAILDKKTALLAQGQFAAGPRAATAVELALDRNQLTQQIAQLLAQREAEAQQFDTSTLDRARSLSSEISANLEKIAVLRELLEEPRLLAPNSGYVTRVRPVPVGVSLLEAAEIVQLRTDERAGYDAAFELPERASESIEPGDLVQVRLKGFGKRSPVLTGTVHAVTPPSAETFEAPFQVTISLSEDSVAILDDPSNGLALRGQMSASTIDITLPARPLSKVLSQSVDRQGLTTLMAALN